jgi:hypothetical protein
VGLRKDAFRSKEIEVPPNRIMHTTLQKFHKWKDKGTVLDGNWDRHIIEFKDLSVYQAFCLRFDESLPWEKTEFYQRVLKEVESGQIRWQCSNKKELDARFVGLDALYKDIRENGYKSQCELPEKRHSHHKLYDDIGICIGRTGELIFQDGRHRLSIAKLLNIASVPVQVIIRHKQWQNFRSEILAYAQQNNGNVYAPLLHPDLADIPSTHGHERFTQIKENLPLTQGTLLDIGAHWGYFCHQFEYLGFECYAVEASEITAHFLEKLKIAQGRNFHIIKKSIFDYKEKNDFDVVLALYIFHHFLKTKDSYNQLIAFLRNLKMKYMILGTHSPQEEQMESAYKNYRPDEFADFIMANSCLTSRKLIGQTNDRYIYILSNE